MQPMFRSIYAGLAVVFLLQATAAAEYRIDSNVQGVKTTVFLLPDKFYSMIGDNGEIVEFNMGEKTFTLINPSLRIQTQLNAEEIRQKVEQLRLQILNDLNTNSDSFHYFAFKPNFKTDFDRGSGTWVLQSPWIDYEIKTIQFGDASSETYYDFCDWVCYLNLRRNPHASQMLTRLEVNRLLRESQRFAAGVSVSIYVKGKQGFVKPDQASSSHEMVRRLSDADRKRIGQAQEFRHSFPQVSFEEYQRRFAENLGK